MPSFDGGQKSDATYARYNSEGILLVRQFIKESDRADFGFMGQEVITVAACRWLLSQDHRWSASHVRLKCAIFTQRIELLAASEMIPNSEAEKLLTALKSQRPKPIVKGEARHPKRREQRAQSKVVRPRNLRKLVRHLIAQRDEFSSWIAGYLQIASRIGFRPGEMIAVQIKGRTLFAPAEKVTNGRGLADTVEIIIGDDYPERFIVKLRAWIDGTSRWSKLYGGSEALRAAMRERIRRACEDRLRIPVVALYALRHFAIACFKKSGWSRAEIAAAVNHVSDRTAGERYGKGRNGIKRPRRLFRVDPARVARVRHSARKFVPLAESAKRKII